MVRASAAVLGVSLAVVLQACSSSGDGGGAGGGGGDPVTLLRTSPERDAVTVPTTANVTLTFSGPLDSRTVTPAHFVFLCTSQWFSGQSVYPLDQALTAPARVAAAVSYDGAAYAITVAPQAPLAPGRTCTLDAAGLRDTGGRAVMASLAFRTVVNPIVRQVSYSAGAVRSWTGNDLDAMGHPVAGRTFRGAGADGQWFTPDDDVQEAWINTYDLAGNWTGTSQYSDPGPDGVWFTGDDFLQFWRDGGFDETLGGQTVVSHGAGADGRRLTADDVVWSWDLVVRSTDGDLLSDAYHQDPGPDATWFTADDPVSSDDHYLYDAPGGHLVRDAWLAGPGPDGAWATADDVVDGYDAFAYDGDPAALLRTVTSFSGPGPDLVWFTSDDEVSGYRTYAHDAAGFRTRVVQQGAGPDQQWFTADDTIQSYRDRASAPNGSTVSERLYTGPGLDEVWFTEDDLLRGETTFDPDV